MASAINCFSCGVVKVTLRKHLLYQSCVSWAFVTGKEELFGFRELGHQLGDCTAGSPACPFMLEPGSVSKQVCAEQDFETKDCTGFQGC